MFNAVAPPPQIRSSKMRALLAAVPALLASAQTPSPAATTMSEQQQQLDAVERGGVSVDFGATNGSLIVTTSAHTVTNIEACAFHPYIDDELNITDTAFPTDPWAAPPLTGGGVIIIGAEPTDVLAVVRRGCGDLCLSCHAEHLLSRDADATHCRLPPCLPSSNAAPV
jgi:hypothetical protein